MRPTSYDGTTALANVHPLDGDYKHWTAQWPPSRITLRRPMVVEGATHNALATVVCLMEGYARLLFSNQASAEARGIDLDEVSRALNTVHPGIDLVGHIIARMRMDPLADRAIAWYRWITASPQDARGLGAVSSLFSMAPGSYGDGHASPDDTRLLLDALARRGAGTDTPLLTRTMSGTTTNLHPLFYFKGASGRRMLADEVLGIAPDQLARWVRGDRRLQDFASTSTDRALRAFFDRGVRHYAPRDCARHLLPDFTRLFDMRFYLVPIVGDIVLMGTANSPVVESLLAVDPTAAAVRSF